MTHEASSICTKKQRVCLCIPTLGTLMVIRHNPADLHVLVLAMSHLQLRMDAPKVIMTFLFIGMHAHPSTPLNTLLPFPQCKQGRTRRNNNSPTLHPSIRPIHPHPLHRLESINQNSPCSTLHLSMLSSSTQTNSLARPGGKKKG